MSNYLRDDLINLKPYDAKEKPYEYKMDANESPWDLPKNIRETLAQELIDGGGLNRYPDSNASNLREAIAKYCKTQPSQILVGAGSDELIGILTTAFIDKGDAVLYPTPSFGMYRIFTLMAGGNPIEVPLGEGYEYDIDAFNLAISKYSPKLLFLCSPNNPTGNAMDPNEAKDLIRNFPGVVVIDEAYAEFSNKTMLNFIDEFPNLVILRTFSKAFGLAGLRIGYCVSNPGLVGQLAKVKPPYNINSFSQRAATLILENVDIVNQRIQEVISQREFLYQALKERLKEVPKVKVYPSEANFLLLRIPDGNAIWQELLNRGFLVRNFTGHPYLEDSLRITIADKDTNLKFLNAMMDIMD